MLDQFIGIIKIFAGNYAPVGWAFCNGQLLSIANNQALFSIIGTTYGGDGRTTFALPDLRGCTPIAKGIGTGLTSRNLGEKSGIESVTITPAQLPAHSHTYNALSGNRESAEPRNNFLAATGGKFYGLEDFGDRLLPMNPSVISPTGGSQPHNNMAPYLAINYVIALEGIYPTRD